MCTRRGGLGAAAMGTGSNPTVTAGQQAAPQADPAKAALITQLQAGRPDQIKYAMRRSTTAGLFRDSADIQTDLARAIGVSSGDIRSWRIMSTPDNNGYVTAEATIDQTTRSWNGGRSMGTGAPTIRTRTTTRYETARVRIIDP